MDADMAQILRDAIEKARRARAGIRREDAPGGSADAVREDQDHYDWSAIAGDK